MLVNYAWSCRNVQFRLVHDMMWLSHLLIHECLLFVEDSHHTMIMLNQRKISMVTSLTWQCKYPKVQSSRPQHFRMSKFQRGMSEGKFTDEFGNLLSGVGGGIMWKWMDILRGLNLLYLKWYKKEKRWSRRTVDKLLMDNPGSKTEWMKVYEEIFSWGWCLLILNLSWI